jgi:hypothetical protein
MNLLGLHLQLLMGPTVPILAPLKVNEALESVEVTHKDVGRSGFSLVFQIGRGPLDLMDYSLLKNPLLKPFNRVILNVFFGVRPIPIMDGIITTQQLAPSSDPGASKFTLIGEDVSVMMDLEQEPREFPGLIENLIVLLVLLPYMPKFGLLPQVSSPQTIRPPVPTQSTPQQSRLTDLAFINQMAGRYGFVFYVEPGPLPGSNTAYWGPPNRRGERQKALSVNMGPNTNVNTISFSYNGLAPNKVTYAKVDGSEETLSSPSVDRIPPLVSNQAKMNRRIFFSGASDGLDDTQRRARAQGELDKSIDEVVTATGELDALRYGQILKPRSLVDLRGAGMSYDGTYYVKSVTHKINVLKGEYKQSFTLTREGTGTLTPFVSP